MSMYLNFEPHTWYMGFAIKDNRYWYIAKGEKPWGAICYDGVRGVFVERDDNTLESLRAQIREYHLSKHTGYGERIAKRRLEQIRASINAESVSYDELAELFKLHEYIADDDVQLREAAGLPEYETQEARKMQHA